MKDRLDKLLVSLGLVETRSKANDLIKRSQVEVDGKIISKAGEKISADSQIKILEENIYVSRAAHKLVKALDHFKLDVNGLTAADIGASTGGFTQVLLENGVSKVYCVDVGHDQLHEKIKHDERVINLEGINCKNPFELDEKVDLCVCDLSFISLTKVFHNIWSLLTESGNVICLIKPQFEAGKNRLGKDAVIRDQKLREEILQEVLDWFKNEKFIFDIAIESPIQGKDGNYEYLLLVKDRLSN